MSPTPLVEAGEALASALSEISEIVAFGFEAAAKELEAEADGARDRALELAAEAVGRAAESLAHTVAPLQEAVDDLHHRVTAEVELSDAKTQGVIIAQAGYFGGWVVYMKDGKVHHEYNYFGLEHTNVSSKSALAPGRHTIVYEFIPDEARPGTGGRSILSIDGQQVAEGHIPKTQPFVFSADEGTDVGVDGETPVSNDYKQGDNAFTGKVVKVTVEQL